MTIFDFLERVPPFVCYYMAREGKGIGQHKSASQIAKDSGLSERTVFRLSQALTWKGVRLEVMDAYCRGCGINFLRTKHHFNWLIIPFRNYLTLVAKGKFAHPLRHLDSPKGTRKNNLKRKHFDDLCLNYELCRTGK